jgi:hypothetical protein
MIYSTAACKHTDKWRHVWALLNSTEVNVWLVLLQLVALVEW